MLIQLRSYCSFAQIFFHFFYTMASKTDAYIVLKIGSIDQQLEIKTLRITITIILTGYNDQDVADIVGCFDRKV